MADGDNAVSSIVSGIGSFLEGAAEAVGSVVGPVLNNPLTTTVLQTGGNLAGTMVGVPGLGNMAVAGLQSTMDILSGASEASQSAAVVGIASALNPLFSNIGSVGKRDASSNSSRASVSGPKPPASVLIPSKSARAVGAVVSPQGAVVVHVDHAWAHFANR